MKKKEYFGKVPESAAECIRTWHETGELTDVQGWYTGTFKQTAIPHEASALAKELEPVQDADDL